MTMWEDLMNCICQNAPNRPGIQEVMDSLERHTVCTGTQCFEGEADAFALTAPNSSSGASNATSFWMFLMFMMTVAMVLKLKQPTSSTADKPGSSSSHADEPPPPPPAAT